MISILTPTYNRQKHLKNAYRSLLQQNDNDFEWIVIDDGSTDNTKDYIKKLMETSSLKINYIYKENGGKHSALNYGIKEAQGELILILDSDDYLSNDAIKVIKKYWDKYNSNNKLCGMTFLKELKNPIYKSKTFDECVSNMIEFKYNNNCLADMCEVIRTDVYKNYLYPVFEGENFLSEVLVTGNMAKHYDMAYIPVVIYYAEYFDDGLSKNWYSLVVNNPLGARANNLMFMSKDYKFSIRLKNCIMFDVFSVIAGKKALNESKMKFFSTLFYLPSWFVAVYLKKKYKK